MQNPGQFPLELLTQGVVVNFIPVYIQRQCDLSMAINFIINSDRALEII